MTILNIEYQQYNTLGVFVSGVFILYILVGLCGVPLFSKGIESFGLQSNMPSSLRLLRAKQLLKMFFK